MVRSTNKECNICNESKSFDSFRTSTDKRTSKTYEYKCCKECEIKRIRANRALLSNRKCDVCESKLTKRQKNYCSIDCQTKGRRTFQSLICKHCDKEFVPKGSTPLHCSMECKNESQRMYSREYVIQTIKDTSVNGFASSTVGKETLTTVARRFFGSWSNACDAAGVRPHRESIQVCKWCYEAIKDSRVSPRGYCSSKCCKAANNQRWVDNRNKRRIVIESSSDSIKPIVVYERDGWNCKLCDKHVDRMLSHPHPLSASIDHIVPISKEGTHTWNNVQLAHLTCNLKKHNKIKIHTEAPLMGCFLV